MNANAEWLERLIHPLEALKAPFPPKEIEWRVGATNGDKTKGMALAYIDARAVMERLDDVCGPHKWQCRYPHANGKTCCEIGIEVNGQWIWKADGAGDTDYEAAKGAFSDSFKRAAVRWGVGRYLYDLGAPWMPVTQRGKSFVFTDDARKELEKTLAEPHGKPVTGRYGIQALKDKLRELGGDVRDCTDHGQLIGLIAAKEMQDIINQARDDLPMWWYGNGTPEHQGLRGLIAWKDDELKQKDAA